MAAPHLNQRHRARNTAVLHSAKKRPCADCGVEYPHYAMDFDHVRGTKEFSIAQSVTRVSIQRLLDEIEKCDVVCANCHRARTHERRTCLFC